MKKRVFFLIAVGFLFVACASNVKPDRELMAKMSLRKLLDYGYEFYVDGNYDGAKMVFEEVLKRYNRLPSALKSEENFRETAAWAEYELGFINYINEEYDSAMKHFSKVGKYNVKAPSVLANLLSSKIEKILGKTISGESGKKEVF